MRKLLAILLFCGIVFGQTEQQTANDSVYIDIIEATTGGFQGGLFNLWSADRLKKGYCKDLSNVRLDEDIGVERKKGVTLVDTYTTVKPVRHVFEYPQENGNKYRIIISSTYINYDNGNYVEVELSTCLYNSNWTGQTVNDNFYLFSDSDTEEAIEWDGTTALRYDDPPTIKYSVVWNEILFGAGDPDAPSFMYHCHIDSSGYINPTQWTNSTGVEYIDFIGANDGQKITGLQVFNGNLYIFKERSTYMAYGVVPTYSIMCVDKNIGCLDGYGVQQLNNKLIVPSHRGIEELSGYTYTLKSRHIQKTIDDINQLKGDKSIYNWRQTSAADWGAGTSLFCDTTTTLGSVYLSTMTIDQNQEETLGGGVHSNSDRALGQSFMPAYTCYTEMFSLSLVGVTTGISTFTIRTTDWSGVVLASMTVDNSLITGIIGNPEWIDCKLTNRILLTAETTYFIYLSTAVTSGSIIWASYNYGYARGNAWTGIGGTYSVDLDYGFTQYIWNSSTHTSQSYNLGLIGFGQWGKFEVNDTKPGASTIQYAMSVTTSANNDQWSGYATITNGSDINLTTATYLRIRSVFETDVSSSIPSLQDYTINWYHSQQTTNLASIVANERYFLSYASVGSLVNDSILGIDTNGAFFKDTGNYASFGRYRGRYFAGSSGNNGNLFELEVDGVYTDSGTATTASYETGDMDFGTPTQKKIYHDFWILLNEIVNGTLTVYVYIDGSDTAAKTWTIDQDQSADYCREGIGFDIGRSGYLIRYKLSSTDNFSIRRIETRYRVREKRR